MRKIKSILFIGMRKANMYHCLLTVLDMPFLTRHLSTSIIYVELDVKNIIWSSELTKKRGWMS